MSEVTCNMCGKGTDIIDFSQGGEYCMECISLELARYVKYDALSLEELAKASEYLSGVIKGNILRLYADLYGSYEEYLLDKFVEDISDR